MKVGRRTAAMSITPSVSKTIYCCLVTFCGLAGAAVVKCNPLGLVISDLTLSQGKRGKTVLCIAAQAPTLKAVSKSKVEPSEQSSVSNKLLIEGLLSPSIEGIPDACSSYTSQGKVCACRNMSRSAALDRCRALPDKILYADA